MFLKAFPGPEPQPILSGLIPAGCYGNRFIIMLTDEARSPSLQLLPELTVYASVQRTNDKITSHINHTSLIIVIKMLMLGFAYVKLITEKNIN